ncbi:heavy-metal-associated domain-containing protein [Niabella ginsengisoli]|uniref:Cation transporter n=1 Tax=Niabella ginsengisoli TaxID=522298 RepID=A0ABS9SGG7_9BACT|nr:heavy metal-associated domain-containing protein [Niabella ginsengisoli]MCH5597451.1 cation transporter [Niabella ginsengisoli]
MTHTYQISGMTCKSCVAKVKNELLKIGEITEAEVQLDQPQATISMQQHVSVNTLQNAISKAGPYTISELGHTANNNTGNNNIETEEPKSWLATYKPLLLIVAYITLLSFLLSTTLSGINWMLWMRVFMSGFFITFSFFKLLNLKGFAESYSMYDIIAKHFPTWGYIYAFIELMLGLSYAMHFQPALTNSITFVVMSVSLIGVLQSVLNRRKIKCACLGAVFNLPMSTVTIIEDAAMILMSGIMLAKYL